MSIFIGRPNPLVSTIDLVSVGFDDRDHFERVLRDALASGRVGELGVDEEGFDLERIGGLSIDSTE